MSAASKIITVRNRVDGVLTDVTSVKFNNAAGTIGVRRQDTLVSVVAAGTAITHQSTGVYQYTISGTLLVVGVVYEYWIERLYGGAYTRQERTFTAVSSDSAEASDPSDGMSLTEARATVRAFTRNGTSTSVYSDDDVDRAIRLIGNRFCRITRCVKHRTILELTEGDSDLPALPSAFRPENILSASIDDEDPIDVVDYLDLVELRHASDVSGAPDKVGFASAGTGQVYPKPDDDYDMTLRWWEAFTEWTIGTESPDGVTLNIPSRYLAEILESGPPCILMFGNIEDIQVSNPKWQRYLQIENSLRGAGHNGTQVVFRRKSNPIRSGLINPA